MKQLFFMLVVGGLFLPRILLADTAPEFLVQEVAQSESWRKQLYLGTRDKDGHFQPRIVSDTFYFSNADWIDPEQELLLNRDALFTNLGKVNNQHAACRFPGRFTFLNQALNLGHDETVLEDCEGYQRWAGLDQYDTLSVVMVEGYYGNPASSFGHLVLRHGRADDARGLLDTSINFGARVPQNEGPFRYMLNGLTGGYLASFTAEAYYRQDLVYTQVEHRDMWSYDLDLTETQRRYFLAHLWELLDSPSTYYFLKNNCAFAVAEILEIVLGQELVNQNTLFYPPVTLFHELEQIDRASDVSVIRAKQFIPSQQSVLRALFDTMTPKQRREFDRYNNSENPGVNAVSSELNEGETAELIEALISYYSYLISGYPELGTELYERRRDLLLARLQYPPGRKLNAGVIEPTTEPGRTARVSQLSAGFISTDDQAGYSVKWAPFSQSDTDLGNNDFSNLTLLAIEVYEVDDEVATEFGLIRVAQRSPVTDRLPGDWPVSWTLDLAWQSNPQGRYRSGGQVDAEVGQSLRFGPLWGTGLVAIRQSGSETGLGVMTELGYAQASWFTSIARLSHTRWLSGESTKVTLDTRISLAPRWSMDLEVGQIERDFTLTEITGLLRLNWHYR